MIVPRHFRVIQAILYVSGTIAGAGSCRDSLVSPPPETSQPITRLAIHAPPTILVNESVLLTVTAHTQDDTAQVPVVMWTSSDESVARISREGVVTGDRRGTATIAASAGGITARAVVRVNAKVRVSLQYLRWQQQSQYLYWSFDPGESLQIVAQYVDVNGAVIDDSVSATWASSDPDVATVSDAGVLVGVRHRETPSIVTASTEDGTGTMYVGVRDVLARGTATLRLAHAVDGLGPITFRRNHGSPVTLAFGESVDLPILSGTVAVQADGLPTSWEGHDYWSTSVALVREGDQLALYAVGDTAHGLLTPTWSTSEPIASDTGLVRFVQGWNSGGIVYIRLPGEPRSGLPELCYFDAGNVSDYFARAAGAFDAIVQKKFAQPAEMARLRWFAEPGRAHTYVFVGDGPTMRWLAFRDR